MLPFGELSTEPICKKSASATISTFIATIKYLIMKRLRINDWQAKLVTSQFLVYTYYKFSCVHTSYYNVTILGNNVTCSDVTNFKAH